MLCQLCLSNKVGEDPVALRSRTRCYDAICPMCIRSVRNIPELTKLEEAITELYKRRVEYHQACHTNDNYVFGASEIQSISIIGDKIDFHFYTRGTRGSP